MTPPPPLTPFGVSEEAEGRAWWGAGAVGVKGEGRGGDFFFTLPGAEPGKMELEQSKRIRMHKAERGGGGARAGAEGAEGAEAVPGC